MPRYSRDSIDRALMHHQLAGVVHTYSPPEQPHEHARRTWHVRFVDGTDEIDVQPATAYAVCVALAAAERTHKREMRRLLDALADALADPSDVDARDRLTSEISRLVPWVAR